MKMFYRTACIAMMMIGLISGVVLAQPTRPEQPPKPPTVEEIVSQLQEQLNLTNEQVEQVRPIFEEEFEKREELFQKNRGQGQRPESRKALDEEFQKLQEETEKQLEEILTEEQMALYRKMLEERRPPQPQGGMPPKPKN
ncbi:hypothetical protein U27_03413 [Candidatus Vecturithrix granuli]|uniref:Aminoacyl-tRNA synthetase class I anticodon-binding domain-containing protein n=1 Tax=Vecturithrix granuli TaxID=1499967 RepID=A0A081BVU6_VECG1|nr:hypothetical protein U27_03413 [Candidatus Vecturithrix granuli]